MMYEIKIDPINSRAKMENRNKAASKLKGEKKKEMGGPSSSETDCQERDICPSSIFHCAPSGMIVEKTGGRKMGGIGIPYLLNLLAESQIPSDLIFTRRPA
jgi:hypothetical protein